MGVPKPLSDLDQRVTAARDLLRSAVAEYGQVTYANSLGAEAMVLTDLICTEAPEIDIFSIDTGRLHQETHDLIDRLRHRYGARIRIVYPDAQALEALTNAQGANGFFESLDARLACCRVRKVEPFRRAVTGFKAWVTGVRREQSAVRARGVPVEWDAAYGLHKVSPLLEWTDEHVWQYIRAHKLPYNALHDKRFPSIGCAPCTRAVLPGEDARAGRWWWERPETRECGLQPRSRPAPALTTP
jgi:phosphoadenosine phosphosulfate reductase